MLPTQRQGRKVVWQGIGKDGRRILEQAFPQELRKRTLEDEMLIELVNGSVFQVVGSDSYDSIVGTNPIGVTFSEWALSDPRAYDFIRPILAENGGFAIFNSTPRGRDHLWEMKQRVEKLKDQWYFSLLTANDTGHISLEDIQAERDAGMAEDRIQQEFYCSFDALSLGLIYDSYVNAAETSNRISHFTYDPRFPVETTWDIGHRDACSILFSQKIRGKRYFIDMIEERGLDMPKAIEKVKSKPYRYTRHILPHDVNKIEFGTGLSAMEVARQFQFPVTVAPKLSIEEGIQQTRALFPLFHFDIGNCQRLVQCLRQYHYEADEDEKTVAPKPAHDWSSHTCDALRMLAVTPEEQGIMPTWADWLVNEAVTGSNWQHQMHQQHNSAWQRAAASGDYDPLSAYR